MCAKQTGKIYYSMGEVTEMFDVNPSLVRFWESKFDILKPHKNKKGNRLFTPADIENLKLIYHLVKEKGMTLSGAQKLIKSNREGINRDLEVIDKLLGIKALLAEIKQELSVGADFEADADEDYLPDEAPQYEESIAVMTPEEEPEPVVDAFTAPEPEEEVSREVVTPPVQEPETKQETYTSPLDNLFFGDLDEQTESDEEEDYQDIVEEEEDFLQTDIFAEAPAEGPIIEAPISEQVQHIVSQNITDIAGEELPEEYIGQLSDEIAEEAATAAEVMEALAELDKTQDKKQGPTVLEQTLF